MMKMILKHLILFILTIVLSFSYSISIEVKSNFDIIDSLSKKAAIQLIGQLDQNRTDSLILKLAQNPSSWLIEQHILNIGKKYEKSFFTQDQEKLSMLNVNIKRMNVEYFLHNNDDSLSRRITLVIANTLEKKDGVLLGLPEISLDWNDCISRDDLPYLENNLLPLRKGNVPEPEQTFFEKIAEPVIFISTAIVTIALLFSVRSG
jgi:hypothetical protein